MSLPLDDDLQAKILAVPQKDEGPQYTKKGTLRKRRPKTKNQYFTADTEEAIIEYLNTTDQLKRNQIYNERIWYGFHKLTENIIHTFKFYYTEVETIAELQHEVTAFLLEKLHLYKQEKGKAFSYFGTIAKRYLILYNNNNYKKLKQRAGVEDIDNDQSITIDLVNNQNIDSPKDEATEFIEYLIKYMDLYLFDHFPKHEDAKTADAIMSLFRRRENIELFNKKAIYIYIREMTDQSTPQITKVLKKMKKVYKKLMTQYVDSGTVSMRF
tara:strand:- start:752 stop:1558 length:807 start_codon:yes stop_codon:yes gene_type:complete